MAKFTLQADERLKSKKLIDQLFESGHSHYVYPIKIMYKDVSNQNAHLKMGVSVPKKLLKKAVDRNLIKRRIKESYRQHCIQLKEACIANKEQKILMFIYLGKSLESYQKIEESVSALLYHIEASLDSTDTTV